MTMKMSVENFPQYHTVYMRRTGAYGPENYRLMAQLKDWVKDNGLWNNETTIFGITRDNPETTAPENCRYDVCLLVQEDFQDDGIQKGTIDGGKYAVFTVPHTSEAVGHFYTSLFAELSNAGHTFDDSRLIMERYINKLVEDGYCEFCVPITR